MSDWDVFTFRDTFEVFCLLTNFNQYDNNSNNDDDDDDDDNNNNNKNNNI